MIILILNIFIYLAARYGKLKVVTYLADKNVNLETVDGNGKTPLHSGIHLTFKFVQFYNSLIFSASFYFKLLSLDVSILLSF